MDPDAALARLVEAALDGDAAELRAAADDLAEWFERGGFKPSRSMLVLRLAQSA